MERGKAGAEPVEQREEQSKASSSAPPTPLPPWIELPPEITADILQRLGVVEILDSAQKVCTTWWKASKDPAIWRTIDMSCEEDDRDNYTYIQKQMMCTQAVDRSQGQAIDIKVTNLGVNYGDLILSIGERCGQLTCLSLDFRRLLEPPINCVTEAVRKLVLLEKLQVRVFYAQCCELIETAGKSCPALKSFTLNKKRPELPSGYDDIALAVAKWMPGLRHLGLEEDSLTNDGLEAILDGCIFLESLHLRRCFKLRIEGELARRCSQQIRDLRIEEAEDRSAVDYEYDHDASWDCEYDYEYDHGDYDPDRSWGWPSGSDYELDCNWWDNDDDY